MKRFGRRLFISGAAAFSVVGAEKASARRLGRENILQLQYPPPTTSKSSTHHSEARHKPSRAELARVESIISATPKGPRPIDVAQSFVDRFYKRDPAIISQAPGPAALNPLISAFFKTTPLTIGDDPIPWCAAFINFCIRRSGGTGTSSAWSQSFLPPAFNKVVEPVEGDLAIFTCYHAKTGKSLGLGHVAFFKRYDDDNQISVIGGNQSGEGHSSIISEKPLNLQNQVVHRHLPNGEYTSALMRLNMFVRPS